MSPARFDREVRDANAHVRAGRVQSEADHRAQMRDLVSWLSTFRRGAPCPACQWCFPDAPYHLCVEGAAA